MFVYRTNSLVYTEFILVPLCRKRFSLIYRNTLESVPGTNQYWAMSVKFLAQGNNNLALTGFEPMRLAILRLLVRRVNISTTPPLDELCVNVITVISYFISHIPHVFHKLPLLNLVCLCILYWFGWYMRQYIHLCKIRVTTNNCTSSQFRKQYYYFP